jgi:hypothetical protein
MSVLHHSVQVLVVLPAVSRAAPFYFLLNVGLDEIIPAIMALFTNKAIGKLPFYFTRANTCPKNCGEAF